MNGRALWLHTMGFALLSAVLVGSLWIIPYLPTNDGPESILAVHIENHFGDPGVIYPEVFQPAPQFAGRGFTVLFEPLEDGLGWQRGLQVALSVIVFVQAWGVFAFVRAVDPRRLPLAFLGFPLALSWPLYMGFFAFALASGVGLFVLALGWRIEAPSLGRRALVAGLLLLQAFFHMFAAILTGIVLSVTAVARAPRGRKLSELARVSLMGLPSAGLAVAAVLVARKSAVTAAFAHGYYFLSFREALAVWPRTVAPGPLARAMLVTIFVVACCIVIGVRALRRRTEGTDRALAALACAFMLMSLFGPLNVPGWQCFSERFVWLGVVLAISAVPFERLPFPRAAAVSTFAAALLWTLFAYPFHLRLAAASADMVAGLSAPVQRHRIWLPITLEPSGPPNVTRGQAEVPFLAPLHSIGSLYATAEGGLVPYTFASNPATWPFSLRPDAIHPPPVPPIEQYLGLLSLPEFQTDLAFRHAQENELATYGMFYEGLLLTGARPEDLTLFHRRGFVAEWERGSVMVGHFEPCAVEITMPSGLPVPSIDVGVGTTMILRNAQLPPESSNDELSHFVVPHGPCGRIWVRPHWDTVTPDGQKSVAFCENASATGEVMTTVTRKNGHAVCNNMGTSVAR